MHLPPVVDLIIWNQGSGGEVLAPHNGAFDRSGLHTIDALKPDTRHIAYMMFYAYNLM